MKEDVIMRIISGKYKGKNIDGYDINGTRPTQDRVKESMFAMIQDYIMDSITLDLFAGSGNLGIEALSNGADKCYFVDNNHECIKILNKNLSGIDDSYVLNMDYLKALEYFKEKNIKFDLVLLDPPYKLECLDIILEKLVEYGLVNNDGIIMCEYEFNNFKEEYKSLKLIKEKKYGYKNIRIYKVVL